MKHHEELQVTVFTIGNGFANAAAEIKCQYNIMLIAGVAFTVSVIYANIMPLRPSRLY